MLEGKERLTLKWSDATLRIFSLGLKVDLILLVRCLFIYKYSFFCNLIHLYLVLVDWSIMTSYL
jgi:hypothetical protein